MLFLIFVGVDVVEFEMLKRKYHSGWMLVLLSIVTIQLLNVG